MQRTIWPFTPAVAALVFAAAAAPPAAAQGPASAAQAGEAAPPAVMEALMADLAQLERKVTALVEAMPDEAFEWRPADGVRSTSEVLTHMAADNYFLPAALGTPAPGATGIRADSYESVQAYEQRSVSREEAMADLRSSFRHLESAMQGADEPVLDQSVSLFGQEFTGLQLWVLTTTHLHEHLGQLIAYARSNGVTPPWSQ